MKKTGLSILLSIVMLIAMPLTAYAKTPSPASTNSTTYSDGSYLVTTVTTATSLGAISLDAIYQTVGTKTIRYYRADNTLAWSFTVTGTFRYNGSTATAISSSASDHIYDSTWTCTSKTSSYSGASATASGTFKNVTLLTRNVSTKLTCSPKGALS